MEMEEIFISTGSIAKEFQKMVWKMTKMFLLFDELRYYGALRCWEQHATNITKEGMENKYFQQFLGFDFTVKECPKQWHWSKRTKTQIMKPRFLFRSHNFSFLSVHQWYHYVIWVVKLTFNPNVAKNVWDLHN